MSLPLTIRQRERLERICRRRVPRRQIDREHGPLNAILIIGCVIVGALAYALLWWGS